MEPIPTSDLLARWYSDDPCPDCGVGLRIAHGQDCDVARCVFTGLQRISCEGEDHRCGNAVHDGYWPGQKDCARLGWTLRHGDQAMADLHRLLTEGVWNRERGCWEAPEGAAYGTPDAVMEWFVPGGLVVKTTERSAQVTIAAFGSRITVQRAELGEMCWHLTLAAARPQAVLLRSLGDTVEIAFEQIPDLADILWSIHQDPACRPSPRAYRQVPQALVAGVRKRGHLGAVP